MARNLIVDTLLVLIALSVVVLTLASHSLTTHGYQLPFGWKDPVIHVFNGPEVGVGEQAICDRPTNSTGFPLAETRPYQFSCFDSNNRVAFVLNNGFYFTGYVLLASVVVTPFVLIGRRSAVHEGKHD